jgi:hypothetical protein
LERGQVTCDDWPAELLTRNVDLHVYCDTLLANGLAFDLSALRAELTDYSYWRALPTYPYLGMSGCREDRSESTQREQFVLPMIGGGFSPVYQLSWVIRTNQRTSNDAGYADKNKNPQRLGHDSAREHPTLCSQGLIVHGSPE